MTKEKPESPVALVFNGRLTVDRAVELSRTFNDALKAGRPLQVDVSAASEIDVTFLQLLFSAHKEALRAGLTLSLPETHPPAMQKALREAGLCSHAGLCATTGERCLWAGGDTP